MDFVKLSDQITEYINADELADLSFHHHLLQRNMGIRFFNSPFNVFVDGSPNGYVFGQYNPL